MQRKSPRLLVVLPLFLSGLINYQAYAAEPAKNPASADQQAATASSEPSKAASGHAANKNTTPAPASSEAAKAKHQPQVAVTKAETTAELVELQSLSIVEALLSGLLTAVFVLVLIRGNLFKHH